MIERSDVGYAQSGDVSVAYRVMGSGSRDILLVLPWLSNLDVLDAYPPVRDALDSLAKIGRLILFDRRGSGLSDRLCGPATLEEGLDDVVTVLDAVGADRPAVFGIHEAGSLCMMLAATHPDRLSHLVLYGTFATTMWQPDYPWGQKPDERAAQVEAVVENWGQPLMQEWMNPSVADDEEFLAWARRWQRDSLSRDAVPAFFEILTHTDVRHVLGSIRVPTLILHRTANPGVPIGNARYLNDHIPESRLVELDGEDYLPFFGDWDAVFGEVEEFITGSRSPHDSQRMLATILFCDVVDSTRLANDIGDMRWRVLLDRLDEVVEARVTSCGGRVVKRLGDGYLATFDRPARGIRAATLIRDDAAQEAAAMRFALHTGEVEVRGDDIGGIAVHIAARVLKKSEAGEVLVSQAIPPLIAGSGLRFEDRGRHELEGIDGEWSLFRLDER
ncbi:MAG: adenylate/guanylate cyclase domain-containing protein [Actinomycetota bacterium]|nr:adenylate/guanylate cyclase domain-containing protein [Actinomycetota bacterium]